MGTRTKHRGIGDSPTAMEGLDREHHALLNAKEAALLLRRSRSWLYSHLSEVPHLRLPGGGAPLFDRETLIEWARGRIVVPTTQREPEARLREGREGEEGA